MSSESRTSKSIKNASVMILFYAINTLLGFWSRQVFFEYLGSEVLGLDTTASSLLSFLNLAELGVGSAIGYFLYRPMYENDTLTINEIVALQGWIYKRIAWFIIIASTILMFFFPIIFKGITIPLWYAYATFSIMLFGALLGYFINYKQCVLYADQKGYKITKVTSTAGVIFRILLILLLPVVKYPFILYISTNICGTIIGCFWINYTLKKEYPWLAKVEIEGKTLLKKYPEIIKKTKQIFFHKITTVIVNQVAPLIMYTFTTLTAVSYYGNYLAVIDRTKDILKNAFSSTAAGVGNLIASRDDNKIQRVFWELFDSRLCISTGAIFVIGVITEPFISLWLSSDYLLGQNVLILICIQSCISINRTTVDSFLGGYGMFQDIWAPAIEAIINLSGCLIFGYFWGIAGVIAGGLLSTIIIVCGWKPYFLFKKGFKQNAIKHYFLPLLKRLCIIIFNASLLLILHSNIKLIDLDGYMDIAIYAIIVSIMFMPLLYIQFYILSQGMRDFHKRIINLLTNVIAK